MSLGIVPMLRSVLVATSVALLAVAAGDAVAAGPSGSWLGTMRSPDGSEFTVELNLDGTGTSWNGSLIEAQRDTLDLEDLRVTATRISFTFRPEGGGIPANFTGGYIAADDRITGTFSLRGTSRFVKFERQATAETADMGAGSEPAAPERVRHPHRLGLTARASYWPAVHLVVDDEPTLNDRTSSEFNYDLTLRYFVMDAFNVFVRGYRGGQGIDGVFLSSTGDVNENFYLKLDGIELGLMGYLGDKIASESRFNPYLTAAAGIVSWEVNVDGRGSELVGLNRDPLQGEDLALAFGLGTEYELSSALALEFEWLWRFFMTKDEAKWDSAVWKDTSAWSLSAGLTLGFW